MVNRGKDSWNKAMLIGPKGRSTAKSSKKPYSPTSEKDGINEGEWICEKDFLDATQNQLEKEIRDSDEVINVHPKNFDEAQFTRSKQMRNVGSMPTRTKRSTNGINNGKNLGSSGSVRNRKKTPLESFDVKAFFEENLYDIIDLEENRSGIKEFEDAVKKDE